MYLILYKSKNEWRWKVQTALPPKTGKKLANGGEGYKNRKHALRMCANLLNIEAPVSENVYKLSKSTITV